MLVVFTPVVLVMVKFTVKEPIAEYVCDAFLAGPSVVLNHVLSPNDQFQMVIPGEGEVSLNCTNSGILPLVGDPMKAGMGRGGYTTMYPG